MVYVEELVGFPMIYSPDFSPGRTQLDTNRTNRTRSSGGKYESARFWGPPDILDLAPDRLDPVLGESKNLEKFLAFFRPP